MRDLCFVRSDFMNRAVYVRTRIYDSRLRHLRLAHNLCWYFSRRRTGEQASFASFYVLPPVQQIEKAVQPVYLYAIQTRVEDPGQEARDAHDEGGADAPWQARRF